MSDFDKEAERERLREQFARDEEKRADTKRMSELLLKGATMTNRHCDTCGDPIFRHEGQEFCATCQGREAETAARQESAETAEETAVDERAAAGNAKSQREMPEPGVDEPATGAERSAAVDAEANGQASPTPPRATTTRGGEQTAAGHGDARDARASLTRTLSKHAAAAERADDPRVAKDHLAAARAAAETLRALDGR